jgi:hypothetical protein
MKPLTEQQKKYLWIAAGVLAVIHFAPDILMRARSAFSPPPVIQKPSPVRPALQQAPPPAPPAPEIVAATRYGGVWTGDAITPPPDMDRCSMKLEIRLSDDLPKKLKGYVSKSCVPLQGLAHRGPISNGAVQNMIDQSAPASVIMTGTPAETGISFTTDQAIGTEMNGCSLSALSITEFGQGQVAASWQETKQEGTCKPGKMMLRKRG